MVAQRSIQAQSPHENCGIVSAYHEHPVRPSLAMPVTRGTIEEEKKFTVGSARFAVEYGKSRRRSLMRKVGRRRGPQRGKDCIVAPSQSVPQIRPNPRMRLVLNATVEGSQTGHIPPLLGNNYLNQFRPFEDLLPVCRSICCLPFS